MNKFLYGVAYYREYMPEERLDEDIKMMKAAGINYVRIAESTWSTYEKQEGIFDFSSVLTVMDKMHENGIAVIIGTPTYAIPAWLAKKHPSVMATTPRGTNKYGPRQKMDITSPIYLRYAERIIRQLMAATARHPSVIGFQIDNETKYYETCGSHVQQSFVKYLKINLENNLDRLNKEFGLDYWSNRVDAWEDFPSVEGTINASLGAEFQKFQRGLVTEFLQWQAVIVREYKSEAQFITHNFDFEWRTFSFGIRSEVDHFAAAATVDIAGIDVYHPGQDRLTGAEIAFTGDIARTTKDDNYLVLETQAQAFKEWTPYPGQLRLQAFSHIASGARLVGYWHWHSIHNSYETYWKGLLSHDLRPNPVYREAQRIGRELAQLSPALMGLKKTNRVALLVSNDSLTAIDWHPYRGHQFDRPADHQYNDVFRAYYDALYRLNIEVDILRADDARIGRYDLLVAPLLYAASDAVLDRLNQYVAEGGHMIYSFKSGFANEHLKVRTLPQPGIISAACGVTYQLFAKPDKVSLSSDVLQLNERDARIEDWMELLEADTPDVEVIARYQHQYWGKYAAITRNRYGKGSAVYIGCPLAPTALDQLFTYVLGDLPLAADLPENRFPVIRKRAETRRGETVLFYLNYSSQPQHVTVPCGRGTVLLTDQAVKKGDILSLNDWDVAIILVEEV